MECEDALESSEITCAELDSLFWDHPSQSHLNLDPQTYAKLEDLEGQIDRARSNFFDTQI